MVKITNWRAGLIAAIMAAGAVYPYGWLATVVRGTDDAAFVLIYAAVHLICAVALCVRAAAPNTGYSLRSLLVNALVIGLYAAGWAYYRTNGKGAELPWLGAVPALLAAITLVWSVAKDRRELTGSPEAASEAEEADGGPD